MRGLKLLFGILVVITLGFCAYKFIAFYRVPVSEDVLEELKQTQADRGDVLIRIGEPTHISDDGITWTFSTKNSWSIIYIHFTPEGKVKHFEIDR